MPPTQANNNNSSSASSRKGAQQKGQQGAAAGVEARVGIIIILCLPKRLTPSSLAWLGCRCCGLQQRLESLPMDRLDSTRLNSTRVDTTRLDLTPNPSEQLQTLAFNEAENVRQTMPWNKFFIHRYIVLVMLYVIKSYTLPSSTWVLKLANTLMLNEALIRFYFIWFESIFAACLMAYFIFDWTQFSLSLTSS